MILENPHRTKFDQIKYGQYGQSKDRMSIMKVHLNAHKSFRLTLQKVSEGFDRFLAPMDTARIPKRPLTTPLAAITEESDTAKEYL